jgi:ribosomal protein S27E
MKVNCSQCGSEQLVMESDLFLRCPYCDARIMVCTPAGTPAMVGTSVSEEYVRRLFPPGMVMSMERKYFPFLETGDSTSRELIPCFSQPWQELDSYRPPAGDRKVFDESMAEPGEIIPIDRELADRVGGRLVLHPFFVVMLKMQGYGEGVLVDGVSGKMLTDPPMDNVNSKAGDELGKLFLKTLLTGLVVSVPLYLLSISLDFSWISRIWSYGSTILVVVAFYYFKTRGKN